VESGCMSVVAAALMAANLVVLSWPHPKKGHQTNGIFGVGLDLIDLEHFRLHYGDEDPELLRRS